MNKYIDAEKLKAEIERRIEETKSMKPSFDQFWSGQISAFKGAIKIAESLQREQPMPDSTQLIAEWEKEKAVLEQKDFRGDAERMAYNAFLDGFVKGIGYGCTK